jgi:hypothetical protein
LCVCMCVYVCVCVRARARVCLIERVCQYIIVYISNEKMHVMCVDNLFIMYELHQNCSA